MDGKWKEAVCYTLPTPRLDWGVTKTAVHREWTFFVIVGKYLGRNTMKYKKTTVPFHGGHFDLSCTGVSSNITGDCIVQEHCNKVIVAVLLCHCRMSAVKGCLHTAWNHVRDDIRETKTNHVLVRLSSPWLPCPVVGVHSDTIHPYWRCASLKADQYSPKTAAHCRFSRCYSNRSTVNIIFVRDYF